MSETRDENQENVTSDGAEQQSAPARSEGEQRPSQEGERSASGPGDRSTSGPSGRSTSGPGGRSTSGPGGRSTGGYGGRPGGGRGRYGRDRDGGGRRGGGRFRRQRRKVCAFCVDKVKHIDYKDHQRLRDFVSDRGKILKSRMTGTCVKHQRKLSAAVKRARQVALLPFVAD